MTIHVIGAGLAGCEAAWQAANRGANVKLYEMRPTKQTPAHHSGEFAELVCSNSLGAMQLASAGGLLKRELELLNSLIIECANETQVPAGGALAVDREKFAKLVTDRIKQHPRIQVIPEECTNIPHDEVTIVASGPLSSPAIVDELKELTEQDNLYFYDAAAPIVTGDSIDETKGFWGARYDRGTPDYFNCPLSQEEYQEFWRELTQAKQAPLHSGIEEDVTVFEGCMPIEVMASRGVDTLRFGPLKPVGLVDPQTGRRPYAVVQLRKENTKATLLNLVGFQTRLTWGEQKRVFSLIPALHGAEFVRYGVMHRNTFINSPEVLLASYQLRNFPRTLIAGQLTGVEGYVESTSSGLVAGINAYRLASGQEITVFPEETMIGALAFYIVNASPKSFQPMNANFGILPPPEKRIKDKLARKEYYAERALRVLNDLLEN